MSEPLECDDQELLARIQRAVPIEHTATIIAGRDYPWTQVRNPGRLLEQAVSETDRKAVDIDPFWAATWRAASGLEQFLNGVDIAGKSILELGCGSGRVGIGAALRGAVVTMTDAVGKALLVARFNARLVKERIRFRRLEWKNGQLPGPAYPIILGSDLVYDPTLYPLLEPCLRRHLTREGVVLLSEPQRHTGDRFGDWIRKAGWRVEESLVDLNDGQRPIRIFILRIPSSERRYNPRAKVR